MRKLTSLPLAVLALLMTAVPAFAESPDYATLFQGVQTEVNSAISNVLPLVVAVFGVLAAVTIGIRLFRKVIGRA